jgi:hypothetical protein
MRRRLVICSLLATGGLVFAAGCSATSGGKTPSAGVGKVAAPALLPGVAHAPQSPAISAKPSDLSRIVPSVAPLVIRTGTVTLRVGRNDVIRAFDEISTVVEAFGGYVQSSATGSDDSGAPSLPVLPGGASLVVRVPSSQFATLAARVESLGKVEYQEILGRDVTGESVNLTARITNLDSEEAALRAILSRAVTIPAILQVQNELFSVEGDVEQLSAEESSLVSQATDGTLTVSIEPVAAAHKKPKPHANAVLHALRLAGHNTVVALRALALGVGWAFPAVIVAAVGLAGWLVWRRRKRRSVQAA